MVNEIIKLYEKLSENDKNEVKKIILKDSFIGEGFYVGKAGIEVRDGFNVGPRKFTKGFNVGPSESNNGFKCPTCGK